MAQNEDLSNGQLPLQGVVLCCTALTQDVRTKLSEVAVQMGATHKLDLTSDVTHLIVGSITTPKYRYVAKDRPDIKVLKPSWIEAVRQSWMEGGDVDVSALEHEHRTPAFSGLQICVTGFDDIEQRNNIAFVAEEQGATYHGDLTKVVTHLIARKAEGKKYEAAKQWELHVVSLKWYEDSLLRGMALDEKLYDPKMPLQEQGVGAFKQYPRPRTSLGKHGRDGESQDAGKKKLRRTASTRLEGHSQDMWQDISARSVSSRHSDADQWKDKDDASTTHVSETTSGAQKAQEAGQTNETTKTTGPKDNPATLFAGSYVLIHGFEPKRTDLLRQYLEPNGAKVIESPKELEDASCDPYFTQMYLLIPHTQMLQATHIPEVPLGTIKVTEWWVERCVHYKRLLDPALDVLSTPIPTGASSVFSEFLISTTGFAGVDLRQIAAAVKVMGGAYQEKILPSSSVLISGSTSIKKEKAFYAQKHRIPIVSADWLWACLRSGKRMPFDKFVIPLQALEAKDFTGEASADSPAPSDLQQQDKEDSRKANDTSAVKRLSSTRSRHATPTLSLQAAKKASAKPSGRPQPILHEDDDDEATSLSSGVVVVPVSASTSRRSQHPLQEVSPNLSPRKTTETSDSHNGDAQSKGDALAKATSRAASPTKPASPPQSPSKLDSVNDGTPAQPTPQQNLNADLAELINLKNTSRPASAAEPSPEKRKKRPLGRASSGLFNRSNSGNLSPAPEPEVPESLEADGYNTVKQIEAPPSTQLGYETPEAEAYRLQMSKKMGTKLQDNSGLRRVDSVGTVKDTTAGSAGGVSGRVRAKHRAK